MANTKINTLKQLRKAPNNGVVLATEGDQLVWKNVSDFTTASDASARTIANEVVEAKKAEIISQVNTAKFIGPVASTTAVDLGTVDSNDLVLVGTQAPYAIYAKINDALVKLGQTDVDLSNYHTKQEIAGITTGIAQAATQEITQAKQEAIAAAEQDATTKANQAKQEAVAEATLAAQQQAQEAARTAGENAARTAEQAKQEAITAAAQDATTKADGVKNELDPRITALESKAYKLKSFYVKRTPAAAPANTELTITLPGVNKPVDNEILSSLSIYLNGVFQNRTDDLSNLFAGQTDGTIVVSFLEDLDDQDVVYITGHYIGEV